jgi:sporulation protein YlmC with PRC-barrel domain
VPLLSKKGENLMDIPINVDVHCSDGIGGHSTILILNPVNEKVTHLVVTEKAFPNVRRLVPVDRIVTSTPGKIQLNCSQAELAKMDPFEETNFIEAGKMESQIPFDRPYVAWPYSINDYMPMPLEHENIPAGEIAIRRYTPVQAADGQVGKVDEFLVDPRNDVITHLVLREGHLWGKKDVTIPVSEIEKITGDAVILKLDKKAIAELPAIPVKRRWK